jgi:DNA-binding PadR family transcriptional regulator
MRGRACYVPGQEGAFEALLLGLLAQKPAYEAELAGTIDADLGDGR